MKCSRCNENIAEGEACNYYGRVLCEDCYIAAVEPARTCDVAAVQSAKKHREMAGQTGTDGLTELQKELYEYVKKQGKAKKQELGELFKLSAYDLEKQIALLRHCELIKARKADDNIYIVPFDA